MPNVQVNLAIVCRQGRRQLVLRLPPELIYYITELLSDDVEALRSASLLHPSWHRVCRPLLFREVVLRGNRPDLDRFQDLLKSDPSVGPLIKVIRVRFFRISSSMRGLNRGPWFHKLPRVLQTQVPNVHTLNIDGLGGSHDLAHTGFFQDLTLLRSIKRLSLVRCCLPHHVLNSFIDGLPRLEGFHIHDHWVDAAGSPPESFNFDEIPDPGELPPLIEFSYHNSDGSGPPTHSFIRWISAIRTLRILRIHVTVPRALPGIGSLIRNLGSSLEHLELKFMNTKSPWAWVDGTGNAGATGFSF